MKPPFFHVAAFACASLASMSLAYSADSAFFVDAAAGHASLDQFSSSDAAYRLGAGYRWAVGSNVLIGVEGGYSDLGRFSSSQGVTNVTRRWHGPTVGADLRFDVTPGWYVSARTGYLRADVTGRVPAFGLERNETVDAWYGGVGAGHDFGKNLSVGIAYDYYRAERHGVSSSPRLLSVNADYRFQP